MFSAKGIDPQDVKVNLDPVQYLIFQGLKAGYRVDLLEFVSRVPSSESQDE
jgi:hypothetical protein